MNKQIKEFLESQPIQQQSAEKWYDPERVRQDKELQETRMPASLEDARTPMEHLKFTLASEDATLFTKQQESRASSSSARGRGS